METHSLSVYLVDTSSNNKCLAGGGSINEKRRKWINYIYEDVPDHSSL